jgi:xanthosine utilization system XapX-like protein
VRRRDLGRILMVAGVLLGVIYTLMHLSNAAVPGMRFGNLILYTGIVALASGLILFGAAGGRGSKKGGKK